MQEFDNEQIKVLNQSIQNKYVKIEILDFNFKVLDSIEGVAQSGTVNINADNDNRRSCNLSIIIPTTYAKVVQSQFGNLIKATELSDKFKVQRGGLIWLDKYIRIYKGVRSLKRQQVDVNFKSGILGDYIIEWYNLGMFIIDAPSFSFSLDTNKLDIAGIDLMARLTDDRYGQLTGVSTVIPAIEYVKNEQGVITSKYRNKLRDAFRSVLTEFGGIYDYFIAPIPSDFEYIPIDIKINIGGTIYALLAKLRDLLPNWEMFFDEYGVFRLQPIPKGLTDTVYPLNSKNATLETIKVDFKFVKNQVVVYGKTHTPKYYVENSVTITDAVKIVGNTLELKIDNFIPPNGQVEPSGGSLDTNNLVSFRNTNAYNSSIINAIKITYLVGTTPTIFNANLTQFERVDPLTSPVAVNSFEPNKIYVLRYLTDGSAITAPIFDFLSTDQVSACVVEDNPQSPYYINYYLQNENYYGGRSYSVDGSNYVLTLNNATAFATNTLNLNSQISFMVNALNKLNSAFTIKDGKDNKVLVDNIPIGNIVNGSFVPLIADKIYDDYTIYLMTYKSYVEQGTGIIKYYFEFNGRLQVMPRILYGGEFDSIWSNELAKERATYELYLHSNLNDAVNIQTISNDILDVNKKVHYENKETDVNNDFLIKSLDISLGIDNDIMTINAIQIYDEILQ